MQNHLMVKKRREEEEEEGEEGGKNHPDIFAVQDSCSFFENLVVLV